MHVIKFILSHLAYFFQMDLVFFCFKVSDTRLKSSDWNWCRYFSKNLVNTLFLGIPLKFESRQPLYSNDKDEYSVTSKPNLIFWDLIYLHLINIKVVDIFSLGFLIWFFALFKLFKVNFTLRLDNSEDIDLKYWNSILCVGAVYFAQIRTKKTIDEKIIIMSFLLEELVINFILVF